MSAPRDPDFVTRVRMVRDALDVRREATKLLRSDLLQSPAVELRAGSEVPLTRVRVLQELFDEVLEELAQTHPELSEILSRRCWLGLSVVATIRRSPELLMSESSFYERQRVAWDEFTFLWMEREHAAQSELNARSPPPPGPESSPAEIEAAREPALEPMAELPPDAALEPDSGAVPTLVPIRDAVVTGGGAAVIVAALFMIAGSATLLAPVQTPANATATASRADVAAGAVCAEPARAVAPEADRFVRSQGVSAFLPDNTRGLIRSEKVRALMIDRRGLWVGYFGTPARPDGGGVGQFDRATWATCPAPPGDVNAIVSDGKVTWVATEKNGVARFDGTTWQSFRRADGLPNDQTFGAAIDPLGRFWVGTWDGLVWYDHAWSRPLNAEGRVLFNNRVHAVAFDGRGGMWVGYIAQGASYHRLTEGVRVHYRVQDGGIGGNEVRAILVRPMPDGREETWFATADGGVSRFADGQWTVFRVQQGLPSDHVRALALDRYLRVWAATEAGVAFFDGATWTTYTRIDTFAIAIGPTCAGCPIDDDHVWTGTAAEGLTHSRLPLPDQVVDVVSVQYPKVVAPGERFRPEFTVRLRPPYQLRQDRGDFLANTDGSDAKLFGAWRHIAVKGTVEAGQEYTFVDFDTEFTAPDLVPGEMERTESSTWRVWMHTRYVGPPIKIEFTVRRRS